jgi:hypothetical protein
VNPGIRLSLLCGAVVLVSSCDRVKRLVGDVKDKVAAVGNKAAKDGGKDAKKPGEVVAPTSASDKPVDPALQANVDSAGGTYRFRKDLPFPPAISIRMTTRIEFQNGRLFQQSALGKQAVPLNATIESVSRLEVSPERVTLTEEKAPHVVMERNKDGKPGDPPPSPVEAGSQELDGKVVSFDKVGEGWKMARSNGTQDFKCAMWGQSIERHLDNLLRDAGGLPSKMWFAARGRLAPGGVVNLRGDEVNMIGDGLATGKLKLVFESVGALNGHPCGIFQISGEVSEKSAPSFDGTLQDSESSITSGRVWLSLLYPVVLKQDLQMVLSTAVGQRSGAMMRTEGAVHATTELEWTATGH